SGSTHGMDVGADTALGKADHGGCVVDRDRLREFFAQRSGIPGCGDLDSGYHLEHAEVPLPVVAGTVGSGDSGAIEHERDAGFVKGDVHEYLVEGAADEGGVDGDDGVKAAEGEPGGARHCVLLCDADVEDAIRMLRGEFV